MKEECLKCNGKNNTKNNIEIAPIIEETPMKITYLKGVNKKKLKNKITSIKKRV